MSVAEPSILWWTCWQLSQSWGQSQFQEHQFMWIFHSKLFTFCLCFFRIFKKSSSLLKHPSEQNYFCHKGREFREIKTLDNSNLNALTHFYGGNHHLKLLSININIKINLEYKGTIILFLRPTGIVQLCKDPLAHTQTHWHTSRTSPYQTVMLYSVLNQTKRTVLL